MKKMKKVIVLAILALGLFFGSCESKTYDEISTVTNPTYSNNIGPTIDAKCTGCHNGSQNPSLTSYQEVKDAMENTDMICLIDDPTGCFYGANAIMPPTGRMQQTTIDMIKLWKTNNYPN
jgi:hypothetical protein